MTTETLIISQTWQQISDGTQTKSVQVVSGGVFLIDSNTQPPSSEKGHLISLSASGQYGSGWANITPPTKAWIRSASTSGDIAEVIIT